MSYLQHASSPEKDGGITTHPAYWDFYKLYKELFPTQYYGEIWRKKYNDQYPLRQRVIDIHQNLAHNSYESIRDASAKIDDQLKFFFEYLFLNTHSGIIKNMPKERAEVIALLKIRREDVLEKNDLRKPFSYAELQEYLKLYDEKNQLFPALDILIINLSIKGGRSREAHIKDWMVHRVITPRMIVRFAELVNTSIKTSSLGKKSVRNKTIFEHLQKL